MSFETTETAREFRNNFAIIGAERNADSKSRFAQVPVGGYCKGKIIVNDDGSVTVSHKVFADELLAFTLGCMKSNPGISNEIKSKLGEVIDMMDARAVAKHNYSHSPEEAAHTWVSVAAAYSLEKTE